MTRGPSRLNFQTACSIVIARLDRAIQYAEASRFHFAFSGILDRPPEPVIRPAEGRTGWRTMTTEDVALALSKHAFAIPRRDPPEFLPTITLEKQEGAGKTGCSARTRGPCALRVAHGSHHRWCRIIRPSLRNGFNGLYRALPGDLALLPPSFAGSYLTTLAPASGRQDHTTLPSATAFRKSHSTGLVPVRRSLREGGSAPLV